MTKPTKLSYEEFIKSSTPLYLNHVYDEHALGIINKRVRHYKDILLHLNTFDAINDFIEKDSEALQVLLSAIDLSIEKFKRIITILRLDVGDLGRTEWNMKRIRKEILQNSFFRKEIIEMFLLGKNSELGKKIPAYYLENANLNSETLKLISDEFYLKKQFKKDFDGIYNNNIGDSVENDIAKKLDELASKYGITYTREKFINWINRNMDFCIPNELDPYVIIESSFQTTTASGQTTKRNDEVKTSQVIRDHNIQKGKNIAFVNLCDGGGWLARQSDLKRIYDCSEYVINLKNLHLLEEIILFHLPPKYVIKA